MTHRHTIQYECKCFYEKLKKRVWHLGISVDAETNVQKIIHKASYPRVAVKDTMVEIGVKSPTHFNRICKKHFKKTPKELMSFYHSEI